MARLVVKELDRQLFTYDLHVGRNVIGRSDRISAFALPAETVSREHCTVDGSGSTYRVTNRSRFGTLVNGTDIGGATQELRDGDVIGVGQYDVHYLTSPTPAHDVLVPTVPILPVTSQVDLVQSNGRELVEDIVELRFAEGPLAGQRRDLTSPVVTLGGRAATIDLGDPTWPRNATTIVVVSGRPSVRPGAMPCFLNGRRVTDLTPIYPDDSLRLEPHVFAARRKRVEARPTARGAPGMVGTSREMDRVMGMLQALAGVVHPVLITGESGTGKEVAAHAIHRMSDRGDRLFHAVNSAAFSEQLFESALFGHERGSFTGADARQDGAFQIAEGGTLFFDEIGELRLDLQAKLLRTLESGAVQRIGSRTVEYPNVRLLFATNRDLRQMIADGQFRADLYYRIEALRVHMPALRDRLDDLPQLVDALLRRDHPGVEIDPELLVPLRDHDWPGNVRELRNVLLRAACLLGGPGRISWRHLSIQPTTDGPLRPDPLRDPGDDGWDAEERADRAAMIEALTATAGNEREASKRMGMSRSTFKYRLGKYGIHPKAYRKQ